MLSYNFSTHGQFCDNHLVLRNAREIYYKHCFITWQYEVGGRKDQKVSM